MTDALSAERDAAVRHVQRASGQVAALVPMIAASRPFPEVAQQLLAVRGSIDSLMVRLVELELCTCLPSRESQAEVDGLLRAALGRNAPHRGVLASRGHQAPPSNVARQGRTTR